MAEKRTAHQSPARGIVLAVALALHSGAAFFYLASGLLAPLYAIILLWIVWLVLLAVLIALWRRRPWWSLIVPPVALGLWYVTLTLGEQLLGWTG
jgi:hypothetical protein